VPPGRCKVSLLQTHKNLLRLVTPRWPCSCGGLSVATSALSSSVPFFRKGTIMTASRQIMVQYYRRG
jgi:hypothetical protein